MSEISTLRRGLIAFRILEYLIGKEGMKISFEMKREILNKRSNDRGTTEQYIAFSKHLTASVLDRALGGPKLMFVGFDKLDIRCAADLAWDILRNVIYEGGAGKHLHRRAYGALLQYLRGEAETPGLTTSEDTNLSTLTEEELIRFFREIHFDIAMINLAIPVTHA